MLRQSTEKLTRKREEADAILHNLVPKYIAEKLKRKEKVKNLSISIWFNLHNAV